MAPSSTTISPSRFSLSGSLSNGDNASAEERTAVQSEFLGERRDSGVRKGAYISLHFANLKTRCGDEKMRATSFLRYR